MTELARVRRAMVITDALMIVLAVSTAQVVRFGLDSSELAGVDVAYAVVSAVLVVVWMLALVVAGAYRLPVLGYGQQEFRAALRAGVGLFAAFSMVSYALQLLFARGYVVVAFPLGIALTFGGRLAWRWFIARSRRRGRLHQRVLAVGGTEHLGELLAALRRAPAAGYVVEGVCCDDPRAEFGGVPVLGGEVEAAEVAQRAGFDLVAWAGSRRGPVALRTLAWDLEPDHIDLLVMSDLTEVSHDRVLAQPVAGLPLMRLQTGRLRGARLVGKTAFGYTLAVLLLLLSLPIQGVIALAILISDRGPVLYRQERVGLHGQEFQILKFRTMVPDAEQLLEELPSSEPARGPMFKLRDDPRVTKIGRLLRRFSLDELPQFLNVLRGDMSLVGPRPPLPREVEAFSPEMARRRSMVRPGMTGLWQVSGRSDLPWDDSARLDLYYVDNWSVTGDLTILAQTVRAVLKGRGAY